MQLKLSLRILLGCVLVVASTQAALAQVKPSGPVAYINHQYGFALQLPPSWLGYKVMTSYCPNEENTCLTARPKVLKNGYVMITIRHPRWTKTHPWQDIPIMICPVSAWKEIEGWQYGAAPVGPRELARNSTFVFAVPPRFDVADMPGTEAVQQLMNGNPLHAF
jgi:hypothetical protein